MLEGVEQGIADLRKKMMVELYSEYSLDLTKTS